MMKQRDWRLAILLCALTAIAYLPAYRGEFIWDDDQHISTNPFMWTAAGLKAIWLQIGTTPQYYPLTHTTFWLEWHVWGFNTLGYHIDNVLLHIAASLLFVRLLKGLRIPGAWLAGFVFALHPVHVESVAWISERKNTLSIFFALLGLITYPRFNILEKDAPRWLRGKNGEPDPARLWIASFIFFLCAMLSKTVTCSLPAVILVLIWFKHGRIKWRDVKPLIPFFIFAAFAAGLTSYMERAVVGAQGDDWATGLLGRTLIAGRAVCWYVGKLVWPANLSFSYAHWSVDPADWQAWVPLISAGLGFLSVLLFARLFGRGPVAATLIFLGTIFPALSFFNLYPHRYSYVADHFQYHSNLALIALICGSLAIAGRKVGASTRFGFAGLLVALLGAATWSQASVYRNDETLWADAAEKSPDSWLAQNSHGNYLRKYPDQTSQLRAIDCFERVRNLRPQYDQAARSLGELYPQFGRFDDSAKSFATAESLLRDRLKTHPNDLKAYWRLGDMYEVLGRMDEAQQVYIDALTLHPGANDIARRRAKYLFDQKQYDLAIPLLEGIRLRDRGDVLTRLLLAACYGNARKLEETRRVLLEAYAIDPKNPGVIQGLQRVNAELNRK